MLRRQGFITVIPDDELDDDDFEALGLAVRRRYDGEVWVVRENELSAAPHSTLTTPRGYGESTRDGPGKSVLSMAAKHKTIPLILKHPDQQFDNVAQHFSGRSNVGMLDLEKLLLETAHGGTHKGFAEAVRDCIVECMMTGKICVLRLVHPPASNHDALSPSRHYQRCLR